MRGAVAFVVLGLLGGCERAAAPRLSGTSATTDAGAPAAASSAHATASASAPSPSASGATPAKWSLPQVPLAKEPTPGPLRVDGYPVKLSAGMSDPASHFGFTRDGSKLVYCAFDVCCASDVSQCIATDAAGRVTTLETPTAHAFKSGAEKAASEPRTKAQLLAFAREERLVEIGPAREMWRTPPPPTGTFAFGGEMTLVVREIAPTEPKRPDGEDGVPGSVKIGARLEGEREVFVVFPKAPFCTKNPGVCYEAQLNGLSLSPDGSELGFVVYIRNPSHGSTFATTRIPVATFAARVFNDTGMRHHEAKEYPRAAELFTRAVYAAPSEERFAYNLACALARQGDARAEHALRHAVALGRDAVRARARKDGDFAGVRAEPWFEAALR